MQSRVFLSGCPDKVTEPDRQYPNPGYLFLSQHKKICIQHFTCLIIPISKAGKAFFVVYKNTDILVLNRFGFCAMFYFLQFTN